MARLVLIVGCLWAMGCAHVQPTQSWVEFGQRVPPGAPVAVTDTAGQEVTGRVAAVSASSLDLDVRGATRRFAASDVRQVRRDGDPLWNGLVIGLGVGVVGAALPDNACSGQPPTCDDRQIPQRAAFVVLATAAGIGIDALVRDRTLLYGTPPSMRVHLRPVLGPGHRRLSIVIEF
jgi:hypothetical protein